MRGGGRPARAWDPGRFYYWRTVKGEWLMLRVFLGAMAVFALCVGSVLAQG